MKTATININLRDDGIAVGYNSSFRNSTVIGMKLLKSGEWVFLIYRTDLDEKLSGYMYEGTRLNFSQIAEILTKFAPKDLDSLIETAKLHRARIKYYRTKYESFNVIGEYNNRTIIAKPQKS